MSRKERVAVLHVPSVPRLAALFLLSILTLLLLINPPAALAAQGRVFPNHIPLPDGFQPEGIAGGRGTTFFVGSLATGAVFRGDLRTGEGSLVVEPQTGRVSVGLDYDNRTNYLYVAGGGTGQAYVYDAATGETVAVFELTEPGTFVNDVVVTRQAAYFTDSFRPYLYRVDLLPNGIIPSSPVVKELELTGDFTFVPDAFNANGIDATPGGKCLVIVQSATGSLYRVNPQTGRAARVDLGEASVESGDGILLQGYALYVVQNTLNQIAVVPLSPDLLSGTVARTLTSDDFDVPTTIAQFGNALYAVNARFGTAAEPDTEYWVTRVPKR